MKKIFAYLLMSSALIHSCMSFADDSPLSPAFVLKPYQSLSVTNIEYSKIKISYSYNLAGVFSLEGSNKAYGTSAIQAIRFGLPDNYEISVAQRYDSYSDDNGRFSGFQNPRFGIRKTWKTTSDININTFGSATPKTGDHRFRDYPTYYDVGIEGVLATPSGLVTVLGLGKEFIDSESRSDSTFGYVGGYKAIGAYSLSLIGTIQSYEGSRGSRDSAQTLSGAIGRSVAKNVWLQLIYRYVNLDYNSFTDDFGGVNRRYYNENQVAASLKVLF